MSIRTQAVTFGAILIGAVIGTPRAQAQTVLYVDAGATGGPNTGESWDTAYVELQSALAVAQAGDEVWVAAGTYLPDYDVTTRVHTGDRTAAFQLITGVAVYGGFDGTETQQDQHDPETNVTILSGDLDGDDVSTNGPDVGTDGHADENSYHVVTGSGTGNTAVLDGFTITRGNANGGGALSLGGGMYMDAGRARLESCIFSANAAFSGGAMYTKGTATPTNSQPKLTNCTFTYNTAVGTSGAAGGGGMYNEYSRTTLENCTFNDNIAHRGGAMYNKGKRPVLTDCTFTDNLARVSGGAMYNHANSTAVITGCTFTTNSARGGLTGLGGAIFNGGSDPILTNCTFNGNWTNGDGGGIHNNPSGKLTMTNCAFINNSAYGIFIPPLWQIGYGGGVSNREDSVLTNCTFIGNYARKGGGMFDQCPIVGLTSRLANCTFIDNTASGNGGGLNIFLDSTIVLTNCTFSGNSADASGGGIHDESGESVDVANSILWGNSDAGGTDESAQIHYTKNPPTVTYNCIQGLDTFAGNGNIGDDPKFVDAANDDLHLEPCSPSIDAGDNAPVATYGIETDYEGNPRLCDHPGVPDTGQGIAPVVDMGAYEWWGDCNSNGVPDCSDIAEGTSEDADTDGIPDECGGGTQFDSETAPESCATHASTEYCLSIESANNDNIECRTTGVIKMVFTATGSVAPDTTQVAVSCVNTSGSVGYSGCPQVIADNTTVVTVAFSSALPDECCCTLTFSGGIDDTWYIKTLAGDVTFNGVVDSDDDTAVQNRIAQTLSSSNFWYDVNASGVIDLADVSAVMSRLNNVAPACP